MSLITNVTDVNGGLGDPVQMDCAFNTGCIPYISCLGNRKQFLLMLQTWESGSEATSAMSGEIVGRSRGLGIVSTVEGKALKNYRILCFLCLEDLLTAKRSTLLHSFRTFTTHNVKVSLVAPRNRVVIECVLK